MKYDVTISSIMSCFTKKHAIFNFMSCPDYKKYTGKMSLESLLTEYIFDFFVLRIIFIDDVGKQVNNAEIRLV